MARNICMDLYGTLTHWQLGERAGRDAARNSEPGDPCPERKDFTASTTDDYFDGYRFGWQDSPFTVAEITFGPSGPGAPVYVRGYASKAALNRAIRAAQCEGI